MYNIKDTFDIDYRIDETSDIVIDLYDKDEVVLDTTTLTEAVFTVRENYADTSYLYRASKTGGEIVVTDNQFVITPATSDFAYGSVEAGEKFWDMFITINSKVKFAVSGKFYLKKSVYRSTDI